MDVIARLHALKTHMYNIVGFHDILDDCIEIPTVKRLQYEAHFTASAVHLAQEIYKILEDYRDQVDPDFEP